MVHISGCPRRASGDDLIPGCVPCRWLCWRRRGTDIYTDYRLDRRLRGHCRWEACGARSGAEVATTSVIPLSAGVESPEWWRGGDH